MLSFICNLFRFVKGSIHYSIFNKGLGEFAPPGKIIALPFNRITQFTKQKSADYAASQYGNPSRHD